MRSISVNVQREITPGDLSKPAVTLTKSKSVSDASNKILPLGMETLHPVLARTAQALKGALAAAATPLVPNEDELSENSDNKVTSVQRRQSQMNQSAEYTEPEVTPGVQKMIDEFVPVLLDDEKENQSHGNAKDGSRLGWETDSPGSPSNASSNDGDRERGENLYGNRFGVLGSMEAL